MILIYMYLVVNRIYKLKQIHDLVHVAIYIDIYKMASGDWCIYTNS